MSDDELYTQMQNEKASESAADIVIAEDDPYISRMYDFKLGLTGHRVAVASSGEEAVELIKKNQPKLVLIDIYMPELNGFEVIESLLGEKYDLTKTEFVFLTNSTRKADMDKAKSMNADYLVKANLTPGEVTNIIKEKLA
ncbi:MAG: response regulator [bacterium]|nr:response regulator [bacterium]